MSVGKTNPQRQMMINMMYLVLTALLALNVSAEILNAFTTVNKGMKKSIENMDDGLATIDANFNKLMGSAAASTEPYKDLADKTNQISEDFYKKIQVIIDRVIEETGGEQPAEGHGGGGEGEEHGETEMEMVNKADLEIAARLFTEEGAEYGESLEADIKALRGEYIEIAKEIEKLNKNFSFDKFETSITLNAENPNDKKSWAYNNFHMIPSIAAVTVLTKIQQDIRTTQSNINNALIASIGADETSFDNLIAVVKANKTSLSKGEPFEAEVLLAAYDSKQKPEILINGKPYEVNAGKALFTGTTTSQGDFSLPGEIIVTNKKTTEKKSYPFEINYSVFDAPAVISPTAMNVLYVGLDNPIKISVPGFDSKAISARIDKGTLTSKGNGEFIAKVPEIRGRDRKTTISVTAKLADGTTKTAGSEEFRILNVPKPEAMYGPKKSGDNITRSEIKLAGFVSAKLENFVFEGITYTVQSYKFNYLPKKGDLYQESVNGYRVTSKIQAQLANARSGDRIVVESIRATSSGLKPVTLAPIVLTVQ